MQTKTFMPKLTYKTSGQKGGKTKKLLITLLFFLIIFSANYPINPEEIKNNPLSARVDSLLSELNRLDMPGAAVAVSKNNKIVYQKGFGSANLEYNIPITPKTVFDAGSIAMQFTGMAIAMLEQQGKLTLDDNIKEYIPGLPDFGKTITIRHLLYHTSGLRDWPQALALAGWKMEDAITSQHILKMVKNQQGLDFEPGSEFLYSNTGYNLLAEIVQRITGKSFRDWTWENIFKPLGMTKTHFHDNSREVVPNKAYSYSYDGREGFLKSTENLTAPGSGSLYSTAEDLSKWILNLESGRVGGKDVIRKMCKKGILKKGSATPTACTAWPFSHVNDVFSNLCFFCKLFQCINKNGKEIDYGFGLQINNYKGLKRFSHNSICAEYGAALHYYPEQKVGVVVLCNMASYNAMMMAEFIADIYLEIPGKEKKSRSGRLKTIKVNPDIYDQYEGQYLLGHWFDTIITVNREGDLLMAKGLALKKIQLLPQSRDSFFCEKGYSRVTFQRDKQGRVNQFTFHIGEVEMQAKKIKTVSITPSEMKEYTGKYFCKELDNRYNIVLEKGKLVVTHRRHSDIKLSLVDRDRFVGNKWFFYEVTFSRNAKQRVTGFNVSGNRPLYYRFEKVMKLESAINRGQDFIFEKLIK